MRDTNQRSNQRVNHRQALRSRSHRINVIETAETVACIRAYVTAADPDPTDFARHLAERLGPGELREGHDVLVNGQEVAWALWTDSAPGSVDVRSISGDELKVSLRRVGSSNLYVAWEELAVHTICQWVYDTDELRETVKHLEIFPRDPALTPRGAPAGELVALPAWESRVYPRTTRDTWLYVPAQYRRDRPACVMVFLDGKSYTEFIPTAFDNLIDQQAIPVTVGVFVQPGQYRGASMGCRSLEYDSVSDGFSRLVLDELLPMAGASVNLRTDAAGRAIAGISSGGIGSFTVAWRHPDQFSKVLSWCGSFTSLGEFSFENDARFETDADAIRTHYQSWRRERLSLSRAPLTSGQDYPTMIRQLPRKPIRLYLQSGERDMETQFGCWAVANDAMARALKYAGYDYRYEFGPGYHSMAHGRSRLSSALQWLWEPEFGASRQPAC